MYKDVLNSPDDYKIEYPQTIIPEPSDTDYSLGFIKRYFIKRSNDTNSHIYEVAEGDYTTYLKNPFWTAVSIKWRIAGPTSETYKLNGELDDKGVMFSNKAAIGIAAGNMKNIGLYLPNLLQFYRK